MVSQMETGRRPIPREERATEDGERLPSIHDALVELLSLSDDKLHVRVRMPDRNNPDEFARGPYREREQTTRPYRRSHRPLRGRRDWDRLS